MDIDYLLALQQLRQSLPSLLEDAMLGISFIGDGPALVAIALLIYWCVDKRTGLFAILAMGIGNFVSQLLKNILCVYRPWVRDARIIPAEGALEGAGGYSFPSGHATGAGTIFGSIAWMQRRRHKVLGVVCILLILIMCFSRNFLGVHTPQDVLVALCVAILAIVVVNALLNWIDRSDALVPGHKRDIAIVIVLLVLCVASIAVIELKAYPMDYANGQLLVDPEQMKKGSFEAAGLLSGVSLGWLFERRFVKFETGGIGVPERVVRAVVGVAAVGVVYVVTNKLFVLFMPLGWAKLVAYFLLTIVALLVVPAIFVPIGRKFRPAPEKRGAHSRG